VRATFGQTLSTDIAKAAHLVRFEPGSPSDRSQSAQGEPSSSHLRSRNENRLTDEKRAMNIYLTNATKLVISTCWAVAEV
jgi:hypothetical protein